MNRVKQGEYYGRRAYVINLLTAYPNNKKNFDQKKEARYSLFFEMDGLHSIKIRAQIDELTQELEEIQAELNRIDHAVAQLNLVERIVIEARYTDLLNLQRRKKSFRTLACETQYAEGTLKNAQTSAIKKLAGLL